MVGKAREDTAVQNWGVLWMLHGLTNGGGFVATDWLLARGHHTPGPYLLLWLPIMALNLASIPLLKRRRPGVRSFVETQIWAIWTAFTGAVVGEFVASSRGLGYLLSFAQSTYNAAQTLALIFIIMGFVLVLFTAAGWLERRLLHWRYA